MEIQMRAVGKLTPYAKNTKKYDQRQIDNVVFGNADRRKGGTYQ